MLTNPSVIKKKKPVPDLTVIHLENSTEGHFTLSHIKAEQLFVSRAHSSSLASSQQHTTTDKHSQRLFLFPLLQICQCHTKVPLWNVCVTSQCPVAGVLFLQGELVHLWWSLIWSNHLFPCSTSRQMFSWNHPQSLFFTAKDSCSTWMNKLLSL